MKKDIENKIGDSIQEYEWAINDLKLYNKRCLFKRILCNTKLVLYKSLPYLISGTILFTSAAYIKDYYFFHQNIIDNKLYINETITNTDYYNKIISINEFDKKSTLSYSTKWYKDEHDLYTRDITHYGIEDMKIDTEVLDYSLEQLNNSFYIINKETIKKEILNEDDELYNEDLIIVNLISEKVDGKRKEDSVSILLNNVCYLILTFIGGAIFSKLFPKYNYIKKDKLKYLTIPSEKILEIKKINKVRQQNLLLLQDEPNKVKKYE